MGLLNAGMLGMLPALMQQRDQPSQMPLPPPQGGPMGGGLAGAFSGNPQFQQQLQAMMQQQSPGFQGAQMNPPQVPVGTTPAQPNARANARGMSLLGRSQG